MAAKGASHVPEFGSWHSEDGVPFTAVFNQARAGKGGKVVNPYDPAEKLFGYQRTDEHQRNNVEDTATISHPQSPLRRQIGASSANREQSELPVYNAPAGRFSTSTDLPRQSLTNQVNQNNGSERGTHLSHHLNSDRSPLHPRASQARHGGRTGSTFGPGTPERSRGRASTKTLEQSDHSSLPKFGAWDANDPSSGDNFTAVFTKARDERKSGGPGGMHGSTPSRYEEGLDKQPNGPHRSNKRWCCCFQSAEVEA